MKALSQFKITPLEALVADPIMAFLASFMKGSVATFGANLVASMASDRMEDALRHHLGEVDWAKVAKKTPPTIARVIAGIMRPFPADMLTDRVFSDIMSAIAAAVTITQIPQGAKSLIAAAIDAVSDEVRDAIARKEFTEARDILKQIAEGTRTPKALGGTVSKKTSTASEDEALAKKERVAFPKLTPKRARALTLMHRMVRTASIGHDTIDIEQARQVELAFINVASTHPELFRELPNMEMDWYTEGLKALDALTEKWARRDSLSADPEHEAVIKMYDEEIRSLTTEITRKYIDEYIPFFTMIRIAEASTSGSSGKKFRWAVAYAFDALDMLSDRGDRAKLKGVKKTVITFLRAHGPPGVAFLSLMLVTTVVTALTNIVAALAASVFSIVSTGGHAPPIAAGVVWVAGSALTGLLASWFSNAAKASPLGAVAWTAWWVFMLMSPLLSVVFWLLWNDTSGWIGAPIAIAIACALLAIFSFMPLEGAAELLRSNRVQGEAGFTEWLIGLIRDNEGGNAPANSGAPTYPQRREINVGTHVITLHGLVIGLTSWVIADLVLAPRMYWESAFGMSALGLIGALLGAFEMFRRNLKSFHAPWELDKSEYAIIPMRRQATALLGGIAMLAGLQFALNIAMVSATSQMNSLWNGVAATFSFFGWLFILGGLALMVSAFWSAVTHDRTKGFTLDVARSAAVLFLAGIAVCTIGLQSYQGGTMADAMRAQDVEDILRKYR